MNPEANIVVTLLTPHNYVELENSEAIRILRQYKNILFRYVNIKDFSKNTPLESWINSDKLSNSKYVVSHTSDVLRFLMLYKYSGLYLDMDVICTYPFGRINLTNFACAESTEYLNGAILKLTGDSGRELAKALLE
jgi:lactosylceramide 4-alpha-galactosyltransferase